MTAHCFVRRSQLMLGLLLVCGLGCAGGAGRQRDGDPAVATTRPLPEAKAEVVRRVGGERRLLVEAHFVRLGLGDVGPGLRGRLAGHEVTGPVFLTEEQAGALVRGARVSREASVVAAPRLLAEDGQQSTVETGSETTYVSDYRVTDDGSGRIEPLVATLWSGVRLGCTATLNPDRTAVRLEVEPVMANLIRMQPLDIPRPAGAARGGPLRVEVPLMETTAIKTTVTVPIGQTIVLGGLRAEPAATTSPAAPAEPVLLVLVKPTIVEPPLETLEVQRPRSGL